TVAVVSHRELADLVNSRSSIRDALWSETLREAALYRAWISSIGRRSAYERLAHLFCEIALRLEAVGLKGTNGYDFMVTQPDLGDALGLSVVHVNRMLQQLRTQNLITFNANTLAIHDWDRLQEIAGFNPGYLQMGHHAAGSATHDGAEWSQLRATRSTQTMDAIASSVWSRRLQPAEPRIKRILERPKNYHQSDRR